MVLAHNKSYFKEKKVSVTEILIIFIYVIIFEREPLV